ncbi:pseudouridine synthase [Bdellovibrionota bacterium FG-1]
MAQERLQKILAKAGVASRRKAEEFIEEGLVTVNGKVAKLGDKATIGEDAIKVKGKLLQGVEAPVYYAFYKPKAVISMMVDTDSRPTLSDYVKKLNHRLFPIGRLDFMSEGLILLTNDGDFAEKLQRRDDVPRVYRIKVKGHPTDDMVKRLEKGAKIENRMVKPHSVRIVRELENKSQLDIVMLGGGAVDIKAMLEMKGFLVDKITRTAIGHLTLHGLAPGHFRLLKASQVHAILEHPDLGLKRLAHEEESEKPKGQRKIHESHESDDSDESKDADTKTRPRPAVAPLLKPVKRAAHFAKFDRPVRSDRPMRSDSRPMRADRPERSDRPSRPGSRPSKFSKPSPRGSFGDSRPRPVSGGPRPFSGGPRPLSRGPRPVSDGPTIKPRRK